MSLATPAPYGSCTRAMEPLFGGCGYKSNFITLGRMFEYGLSSAKSLVSALSRMCLKIRGLLGRPYIGRLKWGTGFRRSLHILTEPASMKHPDGPCRDHWSFRGSCMGFCACFWPGATVLGCFQVRSSNKHTTPNRCPLKRS